MGLPQRPQREVQRQHQQQRQTSGSSKNARPAATTAQVMTAPQIAMTMPVEEDGVGLGLELLLLAHDQGLAEPEVAEGLEQRGEGERQRHEAEVLGHEHAGQDRDRDEHQEAPADVGPVGPERAAERLGAEAGVGAHGEEPAVSGRGPSGCPAPCAGRAPGRRPPSSCRAGTGRRRARASRRAPAARPRRRTPGRRRSPPTCDRGRGAVGLAAREREGREQDQRQQHRQGEPAVLVRQHAPAEGPGQPAQLGGHLQPSGAHPRPPRHLGAVADRGLGRPGLGLVDGAAALARQVAEQPEVVHDRVLGERAVEQLAAHRHQLAGHRGDAAGARLERPDHRLVAVVGAALLAAPAGDRRDRRVGEVAQGRAQAARLQQVVGVGHQHHVTIGRARSRG